jgi:hypothetical protein
VDELTWKWQDYDQARVSEDLWHSGAPKEFGKDRFLVDDKAAALWVVSIQTPAGAVSTKTGWAVIPVDQLSPLDLDSREGLRSDRGHPVSFSVWLHEIVSLSSAEGFGSVAALYGSDSGMNCWLHRLSPLPRLALIKDNSVRSQALSLSDDGSHLALVRGTADDQSVDVLDVNERRTMVSHRLSSLASTPTTPPMT